MSVCNDTFSYACYGCIDLVNNARTIAYHEYACANGLYPATCIPEMNGCSCEHDLPATTYTSPAADNVCWYNPTLPESEEFLGILILNVGGFYDSTYTRTAIDAINIGSSFSRRKLAGKSLAFEVAILATSGRGMLYGINWLKGVLQNEYSCSDSECDSCFGKKLTIRSTCSYDGDCDPNVDDCDSGLSTFFEVALIDGLKIVEDESVDECCCNVMKRGTFTLHSRLPNSYSTGKVVYEKNAEVTDYKKCFDFDFCAAQDCNFCDFVSGGDCDRDPVCGFCGSVPLIIQAPISNECYCYPWQTHIHSTSTLAGNYGMNDTVYRLQLYSGYDADNTLFNKYGLRNTRIEIYRNPFEYPPITDNSSYNTWANIEPCLRIWIPYIPPNATLDIDSRKNTVQVKCKGQCYDYSSKVFPEFDSIFPILTSCKDVLIVVKYDASRVLDATENIPPPGVLYKPTKTEITRYKRWN